MILEIETQRRRDRKSIEIASEKFNSSQSFQEAAGEEMGQGIRRRKAIR